MLNRLVAWSAVVVISIISPSVHGQTSAPRLPVPSKSMPEAVPPRVNAGEPVTAIAKPAEGANSPEPSAVGANRTDSPKREQVIAETSDVSAPVRGVKAAPEIELLFTYGSEKKTWVESVTANFNASGRLLDTGERIHVKPVAMGSGELIDEALSGPRQVHLVSPAASAFIERGNSESREAGKGDLVGPTRDLVSSPIVVAMWRDMAEAIGWPGRNPHWNEIFEYARKPESWQKVARPEWGAFKFGHTQPEFSNSGLHALFAEAYSAVDKFENFNRTDALKPKIGSYMKEVEVAVPYYENSTGFLAQKMIREGRTAMSAAILYENLVIEANQSGNRDASGRPQVVAIYPADGTFPCEHPVGVVNRPWVTEKHRAAAAIYIDYLLGKPQQELALKSGFRPSDSSIDTKGLLTLENGVDPSQPKKILAPPPASAIRLLLDNWRKERNPQAPDSRTR